MLGRASTRTRLTGLLAAVFLAAASWAVAIAPIASAEGGSCSGPQCNVGTPVPGTPGQPSLPPDQGGTPGGFTPGPSECFFMHPSFVPEPGGTYPSIPCEYQGGWWNPEDSCYWGLSPTQSAPPPGRSEYVGAWYTCLAFDNGVIGAGCLNTSIPLAPALTCAPWIPIDRQWMDEPPAGVVQYTPEQAAAMLQARIQISPIEIGLAPSESVHSDDPAGGAYRRTWVGIPVWAWVENPGPGTFEPVSDSDSFGGVFVTGTATLHRLVWHPGDGQAPIGCQQGTPFNLAYWADRPAEDSPSCGWRYQDTSGDGTFTVTAESQWVFNWEAGGRSGQIIMQPTQTSTEVRVGELQSVNIAPPSH